MRTRDIFVQIRKNKFPMRQPWTISDWMNVTFDRFIVWYIFTLSAISDNHFMKYLYRNELETK